MENQIRYIDLGLVSKELYTGIWEYQNVVNVQEPTLLKFSIEKKMPVFFGVHPDDITHILDKLDDKVRIFDAINSPQGNYENGKLTIDQTQGIPTTAFYLEGPRITNFILLTKQKQDHVWPKFQEVISEEVGKFDIKTMWNERNDGSFLINGKWKKFVGGGKVDVFEWTETNMTISYELDIGMANRIRDLDYKKTLKSVYLDAVEYEDSRPHIVHKIKHDGDMSEIIGGLWDIEPSIDQEKLNSDVVNGISKRLNYQVRKENLNGEEFESIINRGKLRLWNDDWMNKGYDTHYKL